MASATLCLGLYTLARIAEQVRAGIAAVAKGQGEAGVALAPRLRTVYRRVILPQAFRIILPTLSNEFLSVFKNSSVALTVGVLELSAQARQVNEYTFQTFAAYGAATRGYAVIALSAYAMSIQPGQHDAAKALALTPFLAYRLVVLPQAFRASLPILLTQTIILFQDPSLIYVISATDLFGAASQIAQRDGRLVEMYSVVGVICFVASQAAGRLQRQLTCA